MDVNDKNLVLISYLQSLFDDYKVKAEFSTNDKDKRVITVQEQSGQKVVFFGDVTPLFNYYQIVNFGLSIRESKTVSTKIGELIGKHVIVDYDDHKWQIIFKQYSNPQPVEYMDIRRIGYTATMQCIVNQVA